MMWEDNYMNTPNISTASELGKAAFAAGRKSVPIHDPALMALLKEVWAAKLSANPYMSAWSKAWHAANASAPY